MRLEKQSHCKVNLLLNILGKRLDGFHELETVMLPVWVYDHLEFAEAPGGAIELTCNHPELPTDSKNLVYRAAELFRKTSGVQSGIRIHLEKKLPLAAGLGGGSANAAVTLLALNELFQAGVAAETLAELAAGLGSDVPFFLQSAPALATGRGENIRPLAKFPCLQGAYIFLAHPGFGIPTAWAYRQLAQFPDMLKGIEGRAARLITLLETADIPAVGKGLFNSLEAPALSKYPLLTLFQQFFRESGSPATLMSGSGSTTFAIFPNETSAMTAREKFEEAFGTKCWISISAI